MRNIDVIVGMINLRKAYQRAIAEVARRHGFSRLEMDVLLFLANNADCDTAGVVSEVLQVAKSNVSAAVDGLLNRGLISREADARDRRRGRLRVLPAARAAVEDARGAQAAFFDRLFTGFDEAERARLLASFEKLAQNVSPESGGGEGTEERLWTC